MYLPNHRCHTRSRSLLRRLSAVFAVCALVFVQLLPGVAAATGTGEWVEICSESGIVLMQVDMGGDDAPDPQGLCPDCAICAFCAALDTAGTLTESLAGAPCSDSLERGALASMTVPANPAQFWSANRGPPLAAEHIISTGALVLDKVSTQMIGGAPWN